MVLFLKKLNNIFHKSDFYKFLCLDNTFVCKNGGEYLSELIFDVEKFVNDFNLKEGVKLFVPSTYTLYSLAGAAALSAYLNTVCKIKTTLVADEEAVKDVTLCLPLTEDPKTIRKNANDFLAIIIDCPDVESCENDSFNKTFCALQIRGKVSMKDFGAEAYNDSDALCGAEIIYNAIQAHSNAYYTYCPEAYNYLYLAMLDATSVFKLHMKTNTFEAIQEIIMNGAEIKIRPECFKKKNSKELEVLEHIYTNCVIADGVGFAVFNDERWCDFSSSEFQNVLEYIRFVKIVDVWIAFVRKGTNYIAYIQGNASGKFDIVRSTKLFGGAGTKKKVKCKIKEEQIHDLINTCKTMVAEGKLKEKPRKKYTHKKKIQTEDAS